MRDHHDHDNSGTALIIARLNDIADTNRSSPMHDGRYATVAAHRLIPGKGAGRETLARALVDEVAVE